MHSDYPKIFGVYKAALDATYANLYYVLKKESNLTSD
jgi:hypothetical protein